ncbi:MAG TPA: hypothetical protein IAA30_08730 [Candidatus Treponema faecavium]|nr:hypothetical protein [Candidatus Treponema faecavium]
MGDTYARTIKELEKRREQIQKELFAAESVIGEKLLAAGDPRAEQELISSYAAEHQAIADTEKKIEEVLSAAEKRRSLQKTLASIKKERSRLEAGWSSLYKELGSASADAGPDNGVPEFGGIYQDIVSLRVQLSDMQHTAAQEEPAQNSASGFAGIKDKLVAKVKNSFAQYSRAAAAKQLEERLSALYIKAGRLICESGKLEEPYAQHELAENVYEPYGKCVEYRAMTASYDERITDCAAQIAAVEETLKKWGVSGNAERSVSAFRHELDEKKKKEHVLCQTAGHAFANLYLLADGEVLTAYTPPSEDDSAAVQTAQLLDRVRMVRIRVADCDHSIAVQTVARDMEQLERRIGSLHSALDANMREIAEIEQRNAEIEKKLAECDAEKAQLVLRRNELEQTAQKSVKQLPEEELQL